MEIVRAKNKYELITEIKDLNGCEEVYLNLRPTNEIIENLIMHCPNVRKIMCPPSLFPQVAKKVFMGLKKIDVSMEPGTFRVGRPRIYDKQQITTIINDKQMGKPAKLIAQERDVPLRTVYFYLKNGA